MAALGLKVTDFYNNSTGCINQTEALFFKFRDFFINIDNVNFTIEMWLNLSLIIGNVSTWYKYCYNNAEQIVLWPYKYVMSFGGIVNYTIALIPNIVSYSVAIPYWIQDISKYEQT